MVIVLAVGAAFCNAMASVLQRTAARSAPDEDSLHLRLVAYLLRRPAYLAGILAMMGAFLLQATALAKGALAVVQPLLVSELLFVLGVLKVWFKVPLGRTEWVGAVCVVVGLGGFLSVANPSGGTMQPGIFSLILAGLVVLGIVIAAVSLSRRGTSAARAALFGAAAGSTFGLTAALIKLFTGAIANHGFAAALASWPPYALAVTGVAAVFLTQNAFQAGPLTASQPALTISDPIVSVAIGVAWFNEHLQAAGWDVVLELFTFAVMALGVILLSQSPSFHSEVRRPTREDPVVAGAGDGPTPLP